jgi:membrane protein required for colicin V production
MPVGDIVIIIVVVLFALSGLKSGFIKTLGSLLGTVLGVYVAGHYYAPLTDLLIRFTGWSPNFIRIVVFLLLFIISNRLIGLVFWFVNKLLGVITSLPFLSTIDHILGALVGVIEGVLVVGIAIFFITRFPPSENFMTKLGESKLAPRAVQAASFLWPLLPKELIDLVGDLSGDKLPNGLSLPKDFNWKSISTSTQK